MKTLYVVATPIGNLEDITIRALKVLSNTAIIACEDTRRTGILLGIVRQKYEKLLGLDFVDKKYLSVRDWNEVSQIEKVLAALLVSDVALVSDAGTPLVSDPGYKLVRAAIEAGVSIVPVPGVSAITTALSVAGLPTEKFKFWGFINKGLLSNLDPGTTHIFFESPHRLSESISRMKSSYPEAEAVVGLEMTKIHEQFLRGSEISTLIGKRNKGEAVLLLRLPSQELR